MKVFLGENWNGIISLIINNDALLRSVSGVLWIGISVI